MSTAKPSEVFKYSGKIYVRPVGRGILLVNEDGSFGEHLDDLVPDNAYYEAEIVFKELPDDQVPGSPS